MSKRPSLVAALVSLGLVVTGLVGCGPNNAAADGRLKVVATTPIIADIARQIAGTDADVSSLIPPGADPHSYEPSLRRARDVAYADVALTNHLLLEPQPVMRQVRATLPKESTLVELSEESERLGGQLIPVVENPALDQLWLGLRVEGSGLSLGGDAEDVSIRLVDATGPGRAVGFVTETFGQVEPVFDSSADDHGPGMPLPPHAHTHLSWVFSKPGIYRLSFQGFAKKRALGRPSEVTFAVGRPYSGPRRQPVKDGHADITLNLDSRRVQVRAERTGAGVSRPHVETLDPATAVIQVGPKAFTTLPDDGSQRELGHPGDGLYLLPQAVLGKHVHGESDPHVWLNPANVQAWAKRIREAFIAKDPSHAGGYRQRTEGLLRRLSQLDADLRRSFGSIPVQDRKLVTTHDAFAYLARAYGLEVAGFAVPATGAEPGARARARLQTTLRDLKVPAVFVGPGDAANARVLRQVAAGQGVQVCTARSDTLDSSTPTYDALMRDLAAHVSACLSGRVEPDTKEPS